MIKYYLWNGSDCNKKIVFKNNEFFSWLKRNSNRTIPDEEIGLMETDFGTFQKDSYPYAAAAVSEQIIPGAIQLI